MSRGQRPYNEDTYQAGVIEIPAFAKRVPISLTRRAPPSSPLQAYREKQKKEEEERLKKLQGGDGEVTAAQGPDGDPQVFYFGVFDGHGGTECSGFLRESLHGYVEEAARSFELESALKGVIVSPVLTEDTMKTNSLMGSSMVETDVGTQPEPERKNLSGDSETVSTRAPIPGSQSLDPAPEGSPTLPQKVNRDRTVELERSLIQSWKDLVGGYFRRFKPTLFTDSEERTTDISTVLTYAFLRADYEFVSAQARKSDTEADSVLSDAPLNATDILHNPSLQIGGPKRFKGGSTCSVAMISTPTPAPFWHPSTSATMIAAHVGDTRILLCRTSDGLAFPATTNHHPNNPGEAKRLRRYAGNFVTDSFGEERMSGLANTRAFGDMQYKRMGVSAEPDIRRIEMSAGEFSFMVMVSDGVSGTLSDQEVVDIIKEAKTPEQGAREVVSFATEVSMEGDNATCICIRLGGWERRSEGGLGSMGTREARQYRILDSTDPRARRS